MTLEYTVPKPIENPFVAGEIVEVCSRDLRPMSEVRVAYAGKRMIRLDDGRRFRASDGWWIGSNGVFPFPSIRHKTV